MKFKDLLKYYDPESEIDILIVVSPHGKNVIFKKAFTVVLVLFSIFMAIKILYSNIFS